MNKIENNAFVETQDFASLQLFEIIMNSNFLLFVLLFHPR